MKWTVAVQLGRVSNLPTVWTNVLAAIVLSGAPLRPLSFAGIALAVSCLYVGGMYLNDAFDREVDARERPERPLPSGRAALGEVVAAGLGLFVLGLAVLGVVASSIPGSRLVGPTLAAGAGLVALIIGYNLHHKGNPWGPLLMAGCRGAVYVVTAVAVGRLTPDVLRGAAVLVAYVAGLSVLAREEGRRGAGVTFGLALLGVPLLAGRAPVGLWWWAASLAFLLWVARALSFLTVWRGGQVGRAIGPLIAGICLVDALLIAEQGGLAESALAMGGAALTLFLQRYVRGT